MYVFRENEIAIASFDFAFQTLLLFSQDADKPTFNLFLAVLQRFGLLFNGGDKDLIKKKNIVFSMVFILDLQWLKNHVDIVEDFSNFLIQV